MTPSVFISTLINFDYDFFWIDLEAESCFMFGFHGDLEPMEVERIQTFLQLPEIKKICTPAYWRTIEWHIAQGQLWVAASNDGKDCKERMNDTTYVIPYDQAVVNMFHDLYFRRGLFASVDDETVDMYKAVARLNFNSYARSLQEISQAYLAPGSKMDISDLLLSEGIDVNWLLSEYGTMGDIEDRSCLVRILNNPSAFDKFSKLIVDLFADLIKGEEKDTFRRTIADIIKYFQASGVYKAKVKTLITSIGMTVAQVQDIISGKKLKFQSITAILPVFFFIPDCSYLYGTTGFPEYVFPLMTIEQKEQLIKAKPMNQLPSLFPSEKYGRATPRFDLVQIANDLIIKDVIGGQDAQTLKKALFVVGKLEQPFLYDILLYVDQMTVWENKKLDILLTEPALADYVYRTIDVYIEWLNQPYRLFLFLLAKSYQKTNKWAFDMAKFMGYAFSYSTGDGMPTLRKRMLFLFNEFGLKSVPEDLFIVSPNVLKGANVFCDALVRDTANSDYSKIGDNPVKVTVKNSELMSTIKLRLDPQTIRNVDFYFIASDLIEFRSGAYELVDEKGNVILPDTKLIDRTLDGTTVTIKWPEIVDEKFIECFKALGISYKP